jgi:uncharacterized protein (UPF0333 family)
VVKVKSNENGNVLLTYLPLIVVVAVVAVVAVAAYVLMGRKNG